MGDHTTLGHSDGQCIVSRVKRFAGDGKKTALLSIIHDNANVAICPELGSQASRPVRWSGT